MPAGPFEPTNIGVAGRRQRRILGIAATAAAVVLLLWLDWYQASRWWRVGVFPLFWFGALGLLQAYTGTCVVLAARRMCESEDTDRVVLTVPDGATAQLLAERAHRVTRWATIVAVVATVAVVALS